MDPITLHHYRQPSAQEESSQLTNGQSAAKVSRAITKIPQHTTAGGAISTTSPAAVFGSAPEVWSHGLSTSQHNGYMVNGHQRHAAYRQPVQRPQTVQHAATTYQWYPQPLYTNTATPSAVTPQSITRFIRPPPGIAQKVITESVQSPEPLYSRDDNNTYPLATDDLSSEFANGMNFAGPSPSLASSIWSNAAGSVTPTADFDDSDSDEDDSLSHPNKYPVEIEYHDNKYCMYKRQATKSGLKLKQLKNSVYDPMTSEHVSQTQHIKYYQKDLVRVCRCGKYSQMDGALVHGRNNDCDGYEIHYSQKCKWKAYDDFKTGKRVLIRLCKCYKPT